MQLAIRNSETLPVGQMHSSIPPITTEIKTPTDARQADTDGHWLREVREMRGRVMYNERGRNTAFLSADGTYIDADPFDFPAHHVLLRSSQRIVACARVSRLDRRTPGYVSTMLGQEKFDEVLLDLGITLERSCEASRWFVATEFRNLGLGPHVIAASWALACSLNSQTAFALAGTRFGQDRLLCRMGAQPVSGLATIPAGAIDDDVRLLYFNLTAPTRVTERRWIRNNDARTTDHSFMYCN
jgi:hypothetical protein